MSTVAPVQPDAVIRKISKRVLLLPFLLGVVSIIDRTNISYASLEMNEDLGFSASVYGLGAGILFFGYFLFEVPSNLLLERFGARRWLARIAVTWGVVAALMAVVRDETLFYVLRFLLGVAEAGLFPGVVLYLTLWFPSRYRARAVGAFMLCVPIASIIGAPLSGWLVDLDDVLGLSGWQFMFVVQGLPAVLLGVVLWWLLVGRAAVALCGLAARDGGGPAGDGAVPGDAGAGVDVPGVGGGGGVRGAGNVLATPHDIADGYGGRHRDRSDQLSGQHRRLRRAVPGGHLDGRDGRIRRGVAGAVGTGGDGRSDFPRDHPLSLLQRAARME